MARPSIDQQITFFYTQDGPKTWAFYEQVVGLPLVLDQGGCRIYRVTGEAYVGFCQRSGARPTDGALFTLVTDEVDAWADHFKANGVELLKEPQHNAEYKIYHFFAKDPNGYLIEVQKFDDPAWCA
ncbi:MAG: VOC family protein [Planctomycetes bacterium]|nr:VOC family protein [Planctomycetota bacterium]